MSRPPHTLKGIPVYAAYGATKAALRSFVRTWAAELAGKGIRANVISPGIIETAILEGQFGENAAAMKERFKTMIPMARIRKPDAYGSLKRLFRQRYFRPPTRAATSPESICRSMAAMWPYKQSFNGSRNPSTFPLLARFPDCQCMVAIWDAPLHCRALMSVWNNLS